MIFRKTLLAGLLVFAVASCGGDDSAKVEDLIEDAINDATSDADTSADGGDDTSGNSSDDSSSGDVGDLGFELTGNKCLDGLQAFQYGLAGFNSAILDLDSFSIDTYRKNMAYARTLLDSSIQDSYDIVANAYDKLAQGLVAAQDAGGLSTPDGIAALDTLNDTFQDPAVIEAIGLVGMYYSQECLKIYR